MRDHWINRYIGEPWVRGVNDCWAFFRRVQRDVFGREVPEVDVDALSRIACTRALEGHEERGNWYPIVGTPKEGDAVLMGRGKHPSHIGVYAGGGVLHCIEHAGAIHQSTGSLRLAGWQFVQFYRHK